MFQRFASVLFGEGEELSGRSGSRDGKEEEEHEEWILVDYLADACSSQRGDALPGEEEKEEQEQEEELVMIPSPMASPPLRYASCTSLDSTAENDPDGGGEEEEEEEGGFLRVDGGSLEESWFVTPPPCFTGRGSKPILLQTSPLENLLIEHPSMSVYAHRSPPRLGLDALPRSLDLDLDLGLLPDNLPTAPTTTGRKEKGRRSLDSSHHRPEVVQRRSSLHSTCYAAALAARSGVLQQVQQRSGRRSQPSSRNALRRINMLRPSKAAAAAATHLHQPSHRHLNF